MSKYPEGEDQSEADYLYDLYAAEQFGGGMPVMVKVKKSRRKKRKPKRGKMYTLESTYKKYPEVTSFRNLNPK